MLACVPRSVNATHSTRLSSKSRFAGQNSASHARKEQTEGGFAMPEIRIEDGTVRIANLDIQDPKAAAILAAYPPLRWAEITRRAIKIGLGYLKGGEKD